MRRTKKGSKVSRVGLVAGESLLFIGLAGDLDHFCSTIFSTAKIRNRSENHTDKLRQQKSKMTFKTYHGFQELEGPLLDAEADTDSVMVSFFEEQYLTTIYIYLFYPRS